MLQQAHAYYKRRRRKDDGLEWSQLTLRQVASGTDGTFVTVRKPTGEGVADLPSKEEPEGPERLGRVVAAAFNKQPRATAHALLRHLSELDRVHLLVALQQSTSKQLLQKQDTGYVDDLMREKRSSEHHAALTKSQIANAVEYQRMLQKFSSYSVDAPSTRQLLAVAVASGLPFVGFGFVDNAILLVAGEQIDILFGARLGISTLASAALGNLVADVVGVSATHQIQSVARHFKWAQPPRLSVLQQALMQVKVARLGGAILGVSIGCIMGMAPLLLMDPPHREQPPQGEQ